MGSLQPNHCCQSESASRLGAVTSRGSNAPIGRSSVRIVFIAATLFLLLLMIETLARAADGFPLSYSGRLTQSSGAPVEGPLDIELRFYATETEGSPLVDVYPFTSVSLTNGIFSLNVQLTTKDAQTILGNGSEPVYAEVTAAGRVYPRQRFSVVPFALRVPVDNSSLVYDTASGKLTINGSGTASPGQILTSDGGGKVRWDNLSYANLSAKTASGSQPGEDQILTYKAGKWVAGNLGDIPSSAGTVTSVTAALPLSVATQTTTPVLSLSQASGSAHGYLSSADWTAFNAKQDAGSYISQLTGDVVASGPGSGSASLAAVALPGTATKVTFDAKGRVISGTSLSAGDISGALGYAPLSTVNIVTGIGLSGGPITTAGTISLASTGVTPGTYVRANVVVDAQGRLLEASSAPQIADADIVAGAGIAQSKIQGLLADLSSKEPALPSGGGVTEFLSGSKTWQSLTTAVVGEDAQNLYYTDARARAALSAASPLSYVPGTGTMAIIQATGSTNGYLSSGDWSSFNAKQSALGFTPVNKSGDTISGILNMGGNDLTSVGNIQIAAAKTLGLGVYSTDPAGLTVADKGKTWFNSAANQMKYWDGTSVQVVGAVGAAVASLNGETGASQSFGTPGSTGTAPAWSSAGNVHTLNIPLASAAAVTAGLLSNTDYATFNAKQPAGSYLTAVTGDITSSGFSSGTVTVTLQSVAIPATSTKVTYDAKGRVTSGTSLAAADLPAHSAALITSGTVALAYGGTGTNLSATGGTGQYLKQVTSGGAVTVGTLASADVTNALGYTPTNKAGDTMSGALAMGGNDITSVGNIQIAAAKTLGLGVYSTDPSGLAAEDKGKTWFNSAANQMKYWDGSSIQVVGAVGGAVASLNNQTGATQSFGVPGTSGTAPAWSSAGNVHTLNIPLASAAGATAGLLSNADYSIFNAKQPAGSYLTNLSGDVISSGFSSGTVTATLQSVAIPATSTKVTYDAKGRITSGTSLAASDLPAHSAALITSGTVALAYGGTGTNLSATGGTGQYLKQVTSGGAVTVGTLASADVTNALGYTPTNKAGDTMSGSLAMGGNDLTSVGNIQIAAAKTLGLGVYSTDPSGLAAGDKGKTWFNSAANQMKYWDGASVQVVGAVGAAVASLNGETGASQSFGAPGSTGTAPAWSSTGNVHTLNIPAASAAGVTAGLLSNADYSIFSAKQPAGSYLTAVTGDITSSGFSSGTVTATLQSVALPATSTKVTYDAKGRITSGTSLAASDLPAHSAALITSGTVALAYGGTGTNLSATGGTGQYLKQVTSGGVVTVGTLASADVTNALGYTPTNKAGDTMSGSLAMGGNDLTSVGNIQIAAAKTLGLGVYSTDPSGLAAGDKGKTWFNSAANQMKYWDGASVQVVGAVGAAVASLNGETGASQSFGAPGSTGTAPAWSSTGNVHTLNIPAASAAGVTAGLLSNADYSNFSAKQPAGSYLTNLSGDIISSGFSSGTVTATLQSVAIPATSTKVTYDAKGRVTSGTSLAASDLPAHSAALITSGTLGIANGGTGSVSLSANAVLLGNGTGPLLAVAPGSSGNVLTSNGSTWSSTAIPSTNWASPGEIGATTPSSGRFTTLTTTGNVGVGVVAPTTRLHVASDTNWEVAATVQNPNAGSDALAAFRLNNNGANSFIAFLNSSGRTVDGGANTATLRNDAGALKLQAAGGYNSAAGVTIAANSGNIGIGTTAPSSILQTVANISGALPAISGTSQTGAEFRMSSGGGATLDFGTKSDGLQWIQATNVSDLSLKYPLTFNPNGGNVGIGTTNPSAILDVSSTTSGFLPPRLTTTQRNAIASPSVGLTVYNITSNLMEMYNGVGWVLVGQNMPEGAIMAFASTSCPAGWTEYSEAYGRFLRGIDKSGASIDLGGQRAPGNIQDQDWKGFSMYNTGQNTTGYSHGPVDMGKSTASYTGNLFIGYWQAPAAALGTKWNTNDEVRPKNVAVLYCRYSGGSGVSVPAGANQVIQDNSSVTVTDSGANGAIALATEGADRLNINASGNVGIGTTAPGIALDVNGFMARKIWRVHGYNQTDGGDNNYVTGRSLAVTKYKAATSLRVLYTDNMRTSSSDGSCRWEVRIDGASCSSGPLAADVYSHGYANVHHNRTFVGYCDTVAAGSHTLAVYVSSTPGYSGVDCFTGWQQAWTLEAEEVN